MSIRQQQEDLLNSIHREISSQIEIPDDEVISKDSIQDRIRTVLAERKLILSKQDRMDLFQALTFRMIGYGPIQPYLEDPEVTEIMVNNPEEIFIERGGNLFPAEVSFRDEDHVRAVIERIIAPVGRRIDESSPYVDARLPDGSRINAVIPPVAIRGPSLTIRKFSPQPFTMDRLIGLGTLTETMARFLQVGIAKKMNMVVSGGTGSGKTSTLNALIREIPPRERLVVIEDTAELQVDSRNYVCLESRPPNIEGKGEISIQNLVRNALRMRPDRIIVGEVRGPEAFDMLQAMNTGHPGSFTTVHANSPIDAVRRIESMVLTAGLELPQAVIREQIASAVDLVLQLERMPGGARKVVSVSEIVFSNGEGSRIGEITVREIFRYLRDGAGVDPGRQGRHVYTGRRPHYFQKNGGSV